MNCYIPVMADPVQLGGSYRPELGRSKRACCSRSAAIIYHGFLSSTITSRYARSSGEAGQTSRLLGYSYLSVLVLASTHCIIMLSGLRILYRPANPYSENVVGEGLQS